jgi:hypothetical protein
MIKLSFHIRAGPPAVGAHVFVSAIFKAANPPVRARRLNPNAPRGSAALRRAAPPKQGARPGWARPCFAYRQPLAARSPKHIQDARRPGARLYRIEILIREA